jgi:flagellum-specific ATP synthase
MAIYRENEDLIQIGAYQPGSSEEIDRAIELRPRWIEFLRQDITERCEMNDTLNALKELVSS